MRAVWAKRYGGPQVLEVRETPDPQPAAGQVRVRVAACSLSYSDVLARQGMHREAPRPPCILGYEGAGVVDSLGKEVATVRAGARVVFLSRFGAHASLVCVPAAQVAAIPESMSFERAAVLPVDYLTAHRALFEVGHLRPDSTVLVHLAASGLGTAALQLCSTVKGVVTLGTASADWHDRMRAEGCHHPLDASTNGYAAEVLRLTGGCGVDLLLDPLGGTHWKVGYSLLRPGGTLVALGAADLRCLSWWRTLLQLARMPRYSPLQLLSDNRGVAGVDVGHLFGDARLFERQLGCVMHHAMAGTLRPRAGTSYPFSRAAEAHASLERDGADRGKPVLVPD
jgi:NADPH:quinone reductase-like Zn-dependent oxidoreductase